MDRRKGSRIFRRCEHGLPGLVEEVEGGKVARCMRCGQIGPTVLGGPEEALRALKHPPPRREALSA